MRVSSSDGHVGVHHPDLLALEEAFVFLDDPKVLEVSEFHS